MKKYTINWAIFIVLYFSSQGYSLCPRSFSITTSQKLIPKWRTCLPVPIQNNRPTRLEHSHDRDHDHDHHEGTNTRVIQGPDQPLSLLGRLLRPWSLFYNPEAKIVLAALLVLFPSIMLKRKVKKIDFVIFLATALGFNVFGVVKNAVNSWIRRFNSLRESLVKHNPGQPLTRKFFFKNENAADRVTLLGVWINIILSVAKFIGGIACNSAVLVADAGHSLSDLFSDFITLWAVQVARLPADEDHPFGHGKFESVGSLFLSLILLTTGVGVGSWSYEKMRQAIIAGSATGSTMITPVVPSWPALVLAAMSIVSKEWLFHVTKRVGEALNSQIVIANAWHHRSDAFSSVLSLMSIALAIAVPSLVVVDSAAGLMVAGMICTTGLEILFESIKQLTDTSDSELESLVSKVARDVKGVDDIKFIRARSAGSGSLVDLTIVIDDQLSASAAQSISEKTRWAIIENLSRVIDVNVKTESAGKSCPLLSQNARSHVDVEEDVRKVLKQLPEVASVRRINVYFVNTALINLEIMLQVFPSSISSITAAQRLISRLEGMIKSKCDVARAQVYLDLSQERIGVETI